MPDFTKRAVLAGAGALAASSAIGQPTAARPRVVIQTALGPITMELADDKAPVTCANFLHYVDTKRYEGGVFYRALKIAPQPPTGLIQGGVKNDPARSYPPIPHESTKTTGLSHTDGAVSMARYDPGTATSEFFICIGNIPTLDADPTQTGDNAGFAVFGHVTDGMDTVRQILAAPVSATAGEGQMKGQMLDPEVAIVSAKRA